MRSILFALGILCCAVAPASASNIIVNGSFEQPILPPNSFTIQPTIPGWYNRLNQGIEVQSNSVLGPGNVAQDGTQYAELNPNNPTALDQDVPTTTGAYQLSFWYSSRPGTGADTFSVSFGGNLIATITAPPVSTVTWTNFTTLVYANSSTSTLEFLGITPSGSEGTLVDNASLQPVPEPSSFALFGSVIGLGLGGLLWSRRRRAIVAAEPTIA
jgi:hypothetical protein